MEKLEMVEAHRDAWIWIHAILLAGPNVGDDNPLTNVLKSYIIRTTIEADKPDFYPTAGCYLCYYVNKLNRDGFNMVLCPCYAGCPDRYNKDHCLGGKFKSFNLAVYNGAWTEAGKIAKEISNMKVVERRPNAVKFLSECMQKHHILWDTISKIFSDQSSRKLIMTALLMYYDQIDNGPQIYTKSLFLMPELTDYYKEFESLLSETPVVSLIALASCAGNIIDYLNQKYFIIKW